MRLADTLEDLGLEKCSAKASQKRHAREPLSLSLSRGSGARLRRAQTNPTTKKSKRGKEKGQKMYGGQRPPSMGPRARTLASRPDEMGEEEKTGKCHGRRCNVFELWYAFL
ncbi:hypothetical protein psal_cds_59 [Pandoravirus salinus]|uniref:Uncharacterized protein n=1 Tax=Pandoravirus salinus TaxID=1349410 RepID=S4VT48_9VIRU|nr:hypothetical protein psal_cds_59 [Pandoravirus salinus]AGO83458.2 hypothetical protein psal_cds_59 [Pandoravirus salinus]